jgi:threonine synthase
MGEGDMQWNGVVRRYRDFLPPVLEENIVTLFEGNTPLLRANNLSKKINAHVDIYLKYEGINPTGSFKDRGMTMALSVAKEEGASAVICASTGNTSASAAAYASKASIKAYVLIPEGKIAYGKLSQAIIHGAKIIQIKGNFDEALEIVKEVSENYPITLVNSLNPFRIEGQKTASFEVCDSLGKSPDYHVLPVGNAGNITSYWRGYKEYHRKGMIENLPKMIGFQAEGAAPIVRGHRLDKPETVATAIRIGNPASWKGAVAARDESGGLIGMVSDEEILNAYKLVASTEGIFCEPASAAGIAGVIKLSTEGFFSGGETAVITLTGHGLKDPDIAVKQATGPVSVQPVLNEVIEELGL